MAETAAIYMKHKLLKGDLCLILAGTFKSLQKSWGYLTFLIFILAYISSKKLLLNW